MRGRSSASGPSRNLVAGIVCLLLTGLALVPGVATASPTNRSAGRASPCSWRVVSDPLGAESGTLQSVSALSPNDAWAVGTVQTASRALPLAEHWNGSAWQVVPTPVGGGQVRVLHDVDAVAGNDVWAVGSQIAIDTGDIHTLVEHWDGARWSVVHVPHARTDHEELLAVAAETASNVWAVGYVEPGITPLPLAMHWNGSSWRVVRAPVGGTLEDVSAHFPRGVWAVGSSAPGVLHALLALHGRLGWQVDPNAPAQDLEAISGRRPRDAWAVGDAPAAAPMYLQPLALHWNGSTWTVAPTPALQQSAQLRGVAAISPRLAWAVGTIGFSHPLLLRWNGTAWRLAAPPTSDGYLDGITRVPGSTTLWAVGNGTPDPLILRYC